MTAGPETVDFAGLQIAFDHRVLRPREWTAHQSVWAAELLPRAPAGDVLELCCGAGHIGLLAVRDSDRRLLCVDLNPAAVELTRANAERAGMADRVGVRQGRISEVLEPDERFAVIIADPPWVPRAQTSRFPDDPTLAIDGGDDGLAVVRECLDAILQHLAPGGVALLQLGTLQQAHCVRRLADLTLLVPGEWREYGDRGVVLRLDRPW